MNELPKRKQTRLKDYDYSQNGYYFITICTHNRQNLFGEIAGSPLRDIVGWFKTMTTNEYIANVKNNIFPPFDKKIWQRNYYEHIIRDERDYIETKEYILNTPLK